MFEKFNPNPKHSRTGDCVIRAICKLMDQDWGKTFLQLCLQGYIECDMPSANSVWGAFLRKNGYTRTAIHDDANGCCTVADFCTYHPHGRYLLALDNHVVCAADGSYFDTWDSGGEPVLYYWEETSNHDV